jgi:cytochrome c-type biogenesis protein CcmH/NrfG
MSKKRAKLAKNRAASKPASPPVCATTAPPDEVDASDPAAAHFFSAPPVTYDEEPAAIVEAEAPVRRVVASPERRRYLGRVVASALALSLAICVAAAVRVATVHADTSVAPPRSQPAQATLSPPAEAVTPVSEEPAETPPGSSALSASSASSAAGAPLPAQAPVAAAANEVAPATSEVPAAAPVPGSDVPTKVDAPVDTDPAAAREAKHTSQHALDRGDAVASIEAGERSTALDPTDAEAWLILGAAYQTRGTYSDARRCFASCVRLAKRGPRGECAALLR